MRTRAFLIATGVVLGMFAGAGSGVAQAETSTWHRHHVRHASWHRPYRGAYHIPRFDQAEAEAEVHTQYRYRTPYLPYWVFP